MTTNHDIMMLKMIIMFFPILYIKNNHGCQRRNVVFISHGADALEEGTYKNKTKYSVNYLISIKLFPNRTFYNILNTSVLSFSETIATES